MSRLHCRFTDALKKNAQEQNEQTITIVFIPIAKLVLR